MRTECPGIQGHSASGETTYIACGNIDGNRRCGMTGCPYSGMDPEINQHLDEIEKVIHELRNFEITPSIVLDGSLMALVNRLTEPTLAIKVRAFAIERLLLREPTTREALEDPDRPGRGA